MTMSKSAIVYREYNGVAFPCSSVPSSYIMHFYSSYHKRGIIFGIICGQINNYVGQVITF